MDMEEYLGRASTHLFAYLLCVMRLCYSLGILVC